MATYGKEKGFTVQTLSTDPVASQLAGGSWAAGGNINAARYAGAAAGPQSAAWIAGGYYPAEPGPSESTARNEHYNGTSWTEVADLNTPRYYPSGAGTQTAGIAATGFLLYHTDIMSMFII